MELIDIVRKLVGPVEPVGETNADNESFENLKKLISLADDISLLLVKVSKNSTRQEASMSRAGKLAKKHLKEELVWLQELTEEWLVECPMCNGEGQIETCDDAVDISDYTPPAPCGTCNGEGMISEDKLQKLQKPIKAGVKRK